MNEKEKNHSVITIKDAKGSEIECEILFLFDSEQTKKSYVVYTDHTKDESGSLNVYANTYDKTGTNMNLMPIETEEEWNTIEAILSKLESSEE